MEKMQEIQRALKRSSSYVSFLIRVFIIARIIIILSSIGNSKLERRAKIFELLGPDLSKFPGKRVYQTSLPSLTNEICTYRSLYEGSPFQKMLVSSQACSYNSFYEM